jgi:hypothetical protein
MQMEINVTLTRYDFLTLPAIITHYKHSIPRVRLIDLYQFVEVEVVYMARITKHVAPNFLSMKPCRNPSDNLKPHHTMSI